MMNDNRRLSEIAMEKASQHPDWPVAEPANPALTALINRAVTGDPLSPAGDDLIAQTALLPVGEQKPDGWRVLTGNATHSLIARVAMRYEIEEGN